MKQIIATCEIERLTRKLMISSKSRSLLPIRILILLSTKSEKWFSLSEISERTGISIKTLRSKATIVSLENSNVFDVKKIKQANYTKTLLRCKNEYFLVPLSSLDGCTSQLLYFSINQLAEYKSSKGNNGTSLISILALIAIYVRKFNYSGDINNFINNINTKQRVYSDIVNKLAESGLIFIKSFGDADCKGRYIIPVLSLRDFNDDTLDI